MTIRTSGDAGFSLLELLVAMTLLGLIGAMAAGAIGFGQAAWTRVEDRGMALTETRVLQSYLRRQIAASEPIVARDGTREPPVLFDGAPDGLGFIAPLAARDAPPGLHLIQIAPSDGGLVLRAAPLGDRRPQIGPDALTEPLPTPSLTFAYFGPDASTGIDRWQDRWSGRTDLPALVSVTAPEWPPLTIRLSAAP